MTNEEKEKWSRWLDRLKDRIQKGDIDSIWSQTETGEEIGEIKVINVKVFPRTRGSFLRKEWRGDE